MYDVDSLQEVIAEERRLALRRDTETDNLKPVAVAEPTSHAAEPQEVRTEQVDSREATLPRWSELFPHGRHIFYEGDKPGEFARQVQFEFGFDVTKDVKWGEKYPDFTSYSFDCPPGLLNLIYGTDRFPMGS